jgi:hypothetical protein
MSYPQSPRTLVLSAPMCALAAVLLAAPTLLAQGKQNIIVNKQDGETPTIAIFERPDFVELRQPDFIQRDLPTFKQKLVLSDEQLAAVERILEQYLEKFRDLTKEYLPKAPEKGMVLKLGDEDAPEFWGVDPQKHETMEGDLLESIDVEGLEEGMPMGFGVGVDVRVGGAPNGPEGEEAAEGDQGEAPPASVSVKFESPDGQEIPEELRRKLEENAARMAEQIKKQVEERMAEGGDPMHGPLLGDSKVGAAFQSIEEMQAYNEEVKAKAEAFNTAKASLRRTFVTDVQTTVLASPQIERWPALERALLRSKTLPKGRLSGERTDLLKVLESLKLNESEQAAGAEHCDSYEMALDAALKLRNDYIADANTKINQAMQQGDHDKALAIVDRGADLRVAVRSVNAQFAELIASVLAPATAEQFRTAVLRVSYPRVYGKTFGHKMFAAAKRIEGLDDETAASIVELERSYLIELESLNNQIRQVIDRHQPMEARRKVEHLKSITERDGEPPAMVMIGDDQQQPIAQAFERRSELDQRYTKRVTALLTPEQTAELPKPPSHKPIEPVVIEIPAKPQ